MLSSTAGRRLTEYIPNYCIFDLETTGLSTMTDAVVEISAVKVIEGKVVDEFTTLVNPECHIPSTASSVNGITDKMVADAPTFDAALKSFLEFVGDMVLVGHNINAFDMKFICRDARKYWGQTIGNDYVDTLLIARRVLPDVKPKSLTNLSVYYGIDTDGAHRALNDCRMNQKIYECLREEMEKQTVKCDNVPECPRCGNILQKRSGRFGTFWGCLGYPECKYTKNV